MQAYRLLLIGGHDNETATFTEEESASECVLTCCYRGKTLRASEPDFFEALCTIRIELEKEGLIPFCYGASLDVFPSAMARQMVNGRAAYKMVMNQPATQEQLVFIFDQSVEIIPATVQEQRRYSSFNSW